MTTSQRDIWSEWLLKRRFGGNTDQLQAMITWLYPVRDKVLQNAQLGAQATLLDVGCGDGLIAFGALDKHPDANVVFSDISQDLLTHTQDLAQTMGVQDRCQFVCAPAEDLTPVVTASIDVVTTRSVLIYVKPKAQAFSEFYRVLKPGGRLSIFEPINRFRYPSPPHIFAGYDVTPVQTVAQKLRTVYDNLQPADDPMIDFDERDLLDLVEQTGFKEIHLELQVALTPKKDPLPWESFINIAFNPKIPTLAEAMQTTLTPAEQAAFSAHLRPLVEAPLGTDQMASAYLWAIK